MKLLILSSQTDHSTNEVIEWLIHYSIPFTRVNGEVGHKSCSIDIEENGGLRVEVIDRFENRYPLDTYTSYWYRRGDWMVAFPRVKKYKKAVARILGDEWGTTRGALHYILEQKYSLGSLGRDKHHNKIISLLTAASVGLNIPATLITTDKNKLTNVVKKNKSITKAIYNMFEIISANTIRRVGTKRISEEEEKLLSEEFFFPTLIQSEIPKAYELRIFFIKEEFYPMAIFSQLDEQTVVDFRNYNRNKPNRCVPYILPQKVKAKLVQFNKIMNLDTGSIDMIVTPDNKFYFIEVNPIGQFGWVSKNCNYRLEEKIALYFKTSDT